MAEMRGSAQPSREDIERANAFLKEFYSYQSIEEQREARDFWSGFLKPIMKSDTGGDLETLKLQRSWTQFGHACEGLREMAKKGVPREEYEDLDYLRMRMTQSYAYLMKTYLEQMLHLKKSEEPGDCPEAKEEEMPAEHMHYDGPDNAKYLIGWSRSETRADFRIKRMKIAAEKGRVQQPLMYHFGIDIQHPFMAYIYNLDGGSEEVNLEAFGKALKARFGR